MDEVVRHVRHDAMPRLILDLGCGTGRFSGTLYDSLNVPVLGLDPSVRMLQQAVAKHSAPVYFVQGSAESIPLRKASVDLIFMSMVLHHLENCVAALAECERVLGPRGIVFVRNGTRDQISGYPAARFFPESVPIMEQTLPSRQETRDVFGQAGLAAVHMGVVEQEIASTHEEFTEQVSAGGDSVLARLNASDIHAGIESLRAASKKVDPLPVYETIDVMVFAKASNAG